MDKSNLCLLCFIKDEVLFINLEKKIIDNMLRNEKLKFHVVNEIRQLKLHHFENGCKFDAGKETISFKTFCF